MLRYFAIASAIALGGSLAIASAAKADTTVDVPFNGTVPFDCQFGPVVPGVLVPVGTPATILSSLEAGGSPGLTDVVCNADADIDITAITKVAGAAFNEINFDATVNGTPALPLTAGVLTNLEVNLAVESDEFIPPDDYSYVVTLTAIP